MKRTGWWDAALIVVALSALVWMPAPAAASQKHDIRVLKREVRALTEDVSILAGEVTVLENFDACFSFVPVNQFGDPQGTYGYNYEYLDAFTPGQLDPIMTTSLDFTSVSDPAMFPFIVADTSCVNTTGRARLIPRLKQRVVHPSSVRPR